MRASVAPSATGIGASIALVTLSLALQSCGARSGLILGEDAANPAGGDTGGTTALSQCAGIQQLEPVLELERGPNLVDQGPGLVLSSDDGQQVSVVAVRGPPNAGPWPTSLEVRHGSFEPWNAWPSTGVVQPTHHAPSMGFAAQQLVVAPATGNRFALFGQAWQWKGSHTTATYFIQPESDGYDDVVGGGWDEALAIAVLSQSALISVTRRASDGAVLAGLDTPQFDLGWTLVPLGCAEKGAADAIVWKSGFLVAFAHGASALAGNSCPTSTEPATRLAFVLVEQDGSVQKLADHDAGAPITDVSLSPSVGGAFAALRVESNDAPATLDLLRLEVHTHKLSGPYAVAGLGEVPLPGIDTAALGSGVVVAWGKGPASAPTLSLTLVDPLGNVVAGTALEPPFVGRLSVVSAPAQPSLAVAWAEPSGAVKVARFDCVKGGG